jgi:hypothetical protein
LTLVRLILELDVQLLQIDFVNSYKDGDRVLYVSPFDKVGRSMDLIGAKAWESVRKPPMNHLEDCLKVSRTMQSVVDCWLFFSMLHTM